jgi:hypothetical protein
MMVVVMKQKEGRSGGTYQANKIVPSLEVTQDLAVIACLRVPDELLIQVNFCGSLRTRVARF